MDNFKVKKRDLMVYWASVIIGIVILLLGTSGYLFNNLNLIELLIVVWCGSLFIFISLPWLIPSAYYPTIAFPLNNKLKNYLLEIAMMAALYLLLGLLFTVMIFASFNMSIFTVPFMLLSVLVVLWYEFQVVQGGLAISDYLKYRYTDKEIVRDFESQIFNVFLIRFKSKNAIYISTILYIGIFLYLNWQKFTETISFEEVFFAVFMTFLTFGFIVVGIKYLTAWWKLRTALQYQSAEVQEILDIKDFTLYNKKNKLPFPKSVIRFLVKINILDAKFYREELK